MPLMETPSAEHFGEDKCRQRDSRNRHGKRGKRHKNKPYRRRRQEGVDFQLNLKSKKKKFFELKN